MQVSLLPASEAASDRMRAATLLQPAWEAAADAATPGESQELHERVRRDEERKEVAVATLVPTGSAEVISEAERNVEFSSRAFRRQVARDGAAEQFQQGRRAFRQALTDARGRGVQANATSPVDAEARSDGKAQPKAAARSDAGLATGAKAHGGGLSAKPAATPGATKSPVVESAAARTSTSASTGSLPPAGRGMTTGASASTTTGPAVAHNGLAASRMVSSAPIQGGKPGSAGGAKTGGTTQPATLAARGAGRAPGVVATKTGRARAAQNAARDANIERIVRVVRGRIGANHSRTVVRLDPPELGSLRLQMDLRGTALTLRVDTSTGLAHRLLSEDLHKLRDGLEAAGIQLERVEVRPPVLTPEASEQDASRHADQHDDARGESAQEDAEHPQERGRESYLAEAQGSTDRDKSPEPTTESSVNVIA